MSDTETTPVNVLQIDGSLGHQRQDVVAAEDPLEIQIMGAQIAVLMRTPGNDLDLVRGFLVTEKVVEHEEQIRTIAHCETLTSPEAEDNVVRVVLQDSVDLDLERLKRNLFATSSCGVCGKAAIENVISLTSPVDDDTRFAVSLLYNLPLQLRDAQAVFDVTGGLHGAALFNSEGVLVCVREDVGRHNAIDKVIGWALEHGAVPLSGHILMVSGRVSFEVVQKACVAGLPLVAAVSAPTSLAVRTAEAMGVTLVGFLRGQRANVYTHQERVTWQTS